MTPGFDDVDRALIAALIADGRATYAALAPIAGLSQASVRSRVQRLLDARVITVTGRVDPRSLGLGLYAFALIEVSAAVDKVAAAMGEIDEVVFAAIGAGRFDVLAELRCRDDARLLEALDRLRTLDGVRRVQSTTVLHFDKQDWTRVGDREAVASPRSSTTAPRELDDIDRRLVAELMADGRASYAALAPVAGLSQAAVRDRVIDLIESGIMSIQAAPVPEAMGIEGFAGLAAKITGPSAPIVNAMVAMPETCVVARTLGRFDLMAEVWFDDADHLANILERLRALPGIGSLDTLPYLRIAVEDFAAARMHPTSAV